MTQLLCKHCDVFVGFGAVGVVLRPQGRSEEWLRDHCWMCHRSIDEVIEENARREGVDPRGTMPIMDLQGLPAEHDHNFLKTKGAGEPAETPVERMSGVYANPGAYFSERASVPLPSPKEVASTALSPYVDKAMFDAAPVPEEGRDRPRVYLLSATPDPLGAVAAFSMMYEGRVIRDLSEITDDERRHYFDECFKTALQTPLEAIDLHFMIEGMTRATFDQMRTQRTAVFAGESLRFAVKDDLSEAVRPGPSIKHEHRAAWDEAVRHIGEVYHHLIANGVPAEDARGLLPLNVLTRCHWKTNLRNLQAEVGKRLCTQAQFEWRLLHVDLRRAIREYGSKGEVYRPNRPLFGSHREVQWQFQYIADSKMFQPICFQKGACMFKASMDRGCTIRDRVDRGEFDKIKPEEWLSDPKAAWVE